MARRLTGEKAQHRKFAVEFFNGTWRLLEKRRRTPEEDLRMVHMAHASRYHWGVIGKPTNWAIGEWQVSHVYAVLRRGEPALYHAKRGLAVCHKAGLRDFYLAYAHEALARASLVAGRRGDARRHLARAKRAGSTIKEADDRKLFERDIATIRL